MRRLGLTAAACLSLLTLPVTLPAQRAPLRLRPVSIRDPMMNNEEAIRLLVPTEWRVEGGIVWHPELNTLALTQLRLSDPRSATALEVFPSIPYSWNSYGFLGVPPGGLNLGSYVVQPMAVDQFVARMLLPAVRGTVRPRIVGQEALPGIARQVAAAVEEAGTVKQVAASRTRIEYQEGGRAIEEDIYCVMIYAQTPAAPSVTMWGADRVFGFRAERGQLDRLAPLLHAIVSSVRVNPVWWIRYLQVRQVWINTQMEGIRQAGELSRYIARTTSEISDMQHQAWQAQQASQDRTHEAFTQYIRGVGSYQDPFQRRAVELPSGYSDVWASRGGEYVLANDPSFNPNVAGSGTWERMSPRAE